MSFHDLTSRRLRARQLGAIDQLVPAMMIANIVCAGTFTILMLDHQPGVLLGWCALVTLMSTVRLVTALHANSQPPRHSASVRAIRLCVLQAAVMGACFVSVPVWLIPQATGMTLACLICLLTGILWAGGLLACPHSVVRVRS